MALRHAVLGLLIDQPDHAYALKRRLSPGAAREQRVNDGVLYPLLAKLERDGFTMGIEDRGRAGRPRRVYSVTAEGGREFRRWLLSDEDELGPPIHELFVAHPLVKLLFVGHLSSEELREKLERHAALILERIAALEAAASMNRSDPPTGLGSSLLELELRQLHDRREWLDQTLAGIPRP